MRKLPQGFARSRGRVDFRSRSRRPRRHLIHAAHHQFAWHTRGDPKHGAHGVGRRCCVQHNSKVATGSEQLRRETESRAIVGCGEFRVHDHANHVGAEGSHARSKVVTILDALARHDRKITLRLAEPSAQVTCGQRVRENENYSSPCHDPHSSPFSSRLSPPMIDSMGSPRASVRQAVRPTITAENPTDAPGCQDRPVSSSMSRRPHCRTNVSRSLSPRVLDPMRLVRRPGHSRMPAKPPLTASLVRDFGPVGRAAYGPWCPNEASKGAGPSQVHPTRTVATQRFIVALSSRSVALVYLSRGLVRATLERDEHQFPRTL